MFIQPCDGKISQGFRSGAILNHFGIDIFQNGYIPIRAIADGIVSRSYYSNSYGEVVFILHETNGQIWESVYAHMKSGSRKVYEGKIIKQGQVIGYMGDTGDASGQHLHFELHKGRWNLQKTNAVDPEKYLEKQVITERPHHFKGIATVIVSSLNLRKQPDFQSEVIKVLKINERYRFYGYENGYWANLGGGYASNKNGIYLRIDLIDNPK